MFKVNITKKFEKRLYFDTLIINRNIENSDIIN